MPTRPTTGVREFLRSRLLGGSSDAQALWEGLRTGGPSGPEMAQLREVLMRAAADAGMSQARINDALQHAHVTIKTGHSVVYPGQSGRQGSGPEADIGPQPAFPIGAGFRRQAEFRRQRPRHKQSGPNLFWKIVRASAMVGGLATIVIPSSALWTSGLMCSSP